MGVPVVCSRQAVGGVDAVPGEHLLACDDLSSLIESILAVLGSPERRAQLSAAARSRVLSHHSWPASMRRVDALIASQFAKRAAA
jgi:glycosyltransferase involved in cell wall biosynthesis